MTRRAAATLCLFLMGGLCSVRPGAADDRPLAPETVQFFEAQVRPVLAEHCIKCHGPAKQKAGLRLDSRAAILAGGDSGPVVVPGNPEESLLVAAIHYGEDGPKMPPSKKLAVRQVADLTRWIKMGAPWPGENAATVPAPRRETLAISESDRAHWAFQPVRSPAIPAVKDPGWAANPIDIFILAGLEPKGLRPNPPASRIEWIRRATFDLTGLPPSPEEVAAFLADSSPGAYDAVVDRLLASPHYGEKWGRHWLDLVRFAETNSYERDDPKPSAWRYRDYVIRAFNQDKPYDRFVREQLAGDELANGDSEAMTATGYYRLGIWDDEPTDRDQARYDSLDDIVATTGQVFLGMTIDCARCHDHKLEPIPQKDYYRLLSFFQNVNHYRNGGPTDLAPIFASAEEKAAFEKQVQDLTRRRGEVEREIADIQNAFRTRYEESRSQAVRQADMEDLRYRYYRDSWDVLPAFDTLKPEDTGTLPRPLFDIGPRTRNESFGFVFEGALIVPEDGDYTFFLDSDDGSRLIVAGRPILEYDGIHGTGQEKTAVVTLPKGRVPIRLDYFQRQHGYGLIVGWSGPGFERRPLSAAASASENAEETVDFARLIRTQGARLLGRERQDRYRALRRELESIEAGVVPPNQALRVTEAGRSAPDTFVLLRGNPHVKGDKVEPAFLQVLGGGTPAIATPAPDAKSTGRRLALADWIASPENPLSPRVMANRVWQHHFGRGIVKSPNNLGVHGDKPTHPALLDWLAAELIRGGWRLKPLHRLIMTSNAYRMSSRPDAEALARDPANDLFWRFDMRRLGAEEVRDSVLAVAGTLNTGMYGPGIYPDVPAEVMAGQSIPGKGWGKSSPKEQARRSVYIHVKRSLLMPILEGFDLAETDRSTPVRFATTQPTQALAMLNGHFFQQQSEAFASRLRREAGDDPKRQVERGLELATGRRPRADEVARGVALMESLRGEGASADSALASFCLVVLNLNEFIYLD